MLIPIREVEDGKVLRSTVCIIGGGAGGISMALEFGRRGIDTILLESDGLKPDFETMDLHRGENIGIPYQFGDGFRNRFLGGDSNGWGGWCRPFDAEDFTRRDWVSNSGWPFGLDELLPYYERAHPVVSLGPVNYDMDYWVKAINRPDVRRMPLPGGEVLDSVSQFSPPTRFGRAYQKTLKNAKHVRVFLHANVVDIETEPTGQTVRRVQIPGLFSLNIYTPLRFYYFVFAFVALSLLILNRILESPFRKVLQGIRENEKRARAVGYHTGRVKWLSFILSGTFSGLAGALHTLYINFVGLEQLYWETSGKILLMTLLGGPGTIFGPFIGAGVFLYLEDIISGFTKYWMIVLGPIFVLCVLFFPQGIWGTIQDFADRSRRVSSPRG